jgi:hypothetical protein
MKTIKKSIAVGETEESCLMKDDLAGNWTTSPIIDSGASMSSISYKLWNSSTFVWLTDNFGLSV